MSQIPYSKKISFSYKIPYAEHLRNIVCSVLKIKIKGGLFCVLPSSHVLRNAVPLFRNLYI